MRALSTAWQSALRDPSRRLVILATISPTGCDPTTDRLHLACQPMSICCATDTQVTVSGGPGGASVPFWPWLLEWPAIDHRFSIRERRLEIAECTLRVSRGSELATLLNSAGGGLTATVRLDLWTDDIPLSDVIPLMAGPVREAPIITELTSGVQLVVTDGDPDNDLTFPGGPLTPADLPDAPFTALDAAEHQAILGSFPYPVSAIQMDAVGRIFYLCSHPLTARPSLIMRNGVPVSVAVDVREWTTPSGYTITQLVFPEPVGSLAEGGLVTDSITCAGGIGLSGTHAVLTLLEQFGGYTVTPRARQRLMTTPFELSVLVNTNGAVIALVRDRLLPQTNLCFGFRRGAADVIPLGPAESQLTLALGAGLRYRVADQPSETAVDAIANDITIVCGQTTTGSIRTSVRRSRETPGIVGRRLAQSRQRYGVRPLIFNALDLPVVDDAGTVSCPLGERLADLVAMAQSLPARPVTYALERLEGMWLELGDGARLTDAEQGTTEAPARVSRWQLTPAGPVLTFESDPWG